MSRPVKVLMVEDREDSAEMVVQILSHGGYEPTWRRVDTAAALDTALRDEVWDIALIDYHLPAFSGPAALAMVRERKIDMPCIIMSGMVGEEVAVKLLKTGAADFVPKDKPSRLLPVIERELRERETRRARDRAEEALRESEERYRLLYASSTDSLMVLDPARGFISGNPATLRLFGCADEAEFTARRPDDFSPEYQPDGTLSSDRAEKMIGTALENGSHFFEWTHKRMKGEEFLTTVLLSRFQLDGQSMLQATVRDITEEREVEKEQQRLQVQLLHAQKLESIGQLAAGIAHEINTPIQYIGDHTRFVKDSFDGLISLLQVYERVFQEARAAGAAPSENLAAVEAARESADVEYVLDRVPNALEQVLDGVSRVATIVRAMKDFSHPGQADKAPVDLNRCIESTVTVARNEWKYVADLDLDLDRNLPFVSCLPGEINQAVLNIIVNAAHAIGDAQKAAGNDGKGRITVQTHRDGDWAEIRIGDTGPGIPKAVQSKVFDPFFTTKEVGRGTGQGLAIAYQAVTKKHGGTIKFETEEGKGATFIIRLPIGEGVVTDNR